MNSLTTTLLVLTVFLVLLPSETYAFGAGDIPDFAYLNGKAFRHGDIEGILADLAKTVGHAGGSGLLEFAQSVLSAASGGEGGSKFSKEDVKRVYFGNWLRDYSQAMDIAGLSKLSADTLVLIVSILGFLTFGFATEEFQVTADRLGVYLPTEHIDNPKGYAEKEGDARQFHPKLRPPVNPEELEIDERTGMKNYMASENRGWDTSTALIRRVFRSCIEHGRRAQGHEGGDLWEAYRLLGTGLHTMEDLLAHSNWCELGLRKMGHNDVFCHVGDNVLINTPSGETHPLVTGTFGGADFLHSLMGEATDHLSQASVVDLSKKMEEAAQGGDDNKLNALRSILKSLPIGGSDADDQMGQANSMQEQAKAYNFDPDNVAPPEVREQLWRLLEWRDNIYRDIIKKIEMVPGLSDLLENLTNALNAFVYTVLAPYVTPILKQVTEVLTEGSKAVIDTEDQYLVFDDSNTSDPSHSLLSKDHFALILNEPAGKIAQVVVQYSVKLLVQAWFDNENPDRVIDQILEAFHHPWYATGRSHIQDEMYRTLESWVGSLENVEETMQALTKESVRAGKNKRQGSDDDIASSDQIYGGHINQNVGGQQYGSTGTGYGSTQGYGSSQGYGASGGYNASERRKYGESGESYSSYSGGYDRKPDETSSDYGRRREGSGYGDESSRQNQSSYERVSGHGGSYGRQEDPGYQRREEGRYPESDSYGGGSGGSHREEDSYGSRPSYGEDERPHRHQEALGSGYGESRRDDSNNYGSSRGDEHEGYGRRRDEGYTDGDNYRSGYNNDNRREERSEYGRQEGGYNEGYAPSYNRGGYEGRGGTGGSEYGNRRGENEYSGNYGGERSAGYGRQEGGYGDSGETYGVEGLSLDEEGRQHHGRHHRKDDSDNEGY